LGDVFLSDHVGERGGSVASRHDFVHGNHREAGGEFGTTFANDRFLGRHSIADQGF
jgi:hypothetical protein